MNSLTTLNKVSQGFQKLNILEVNQRYKIEKLSTITTKYGNSIIATLDEVGDVILPKRFGTLSDKVDQINSVIQSENKIYLIVRDKIGKYTPIDFTE